MKPYEKQLGRLDKLGIKHYQEFSGFLGPRYWEITHPDGKTEFACKVKELKEIADREEVVVYVPNR
jgi:hypothetical protein